MTILQSLKKLHKKMTGQETNSKTIGGILDSMQENYNGGSGGSSDGDTFETVAEINIGTMEFEKGEYYYHTEYTELPNLNENDIVYLNDINCVSTSIYQDIEGLHILFNADANSLYEIIPLDNQPGYKFYWITEENEYPALNISSTSNAIENTTVRILKKISSSESGSNLPDPGAVGNVLTSTGTGWESAAPPASDNDYIIDAELTVDLATQSFGVSPVEHDIADVYAAAAENKNIRLIAVNDTYGIRVTLDAALSQSGDYIIFSGTMIGFDGNPFAFVVTAENYNDAAVPTIKFAPVIVPTLPVPTADNNGKILGVDDGAYALVSPSALSNAPLILEFSIDQQTYGIEITNHTAAEIAEAWSANRPIYGAMANVRLEVVEVNYTADNNYLFKAAAKSFDTPNGTMQQFVALFVSSLSGTVALFNFASVT